MMRTGKSGNPKQFVPWDWLGKTGSGIFSKYAKIFDEEKVEKCDLIQSPFTIIHPLGIRGVFRPSEIDEILQLTEELAA